MIEQKSSSEMSGKTFGRAVEAFALCVKTALLVHGGLKAGVSPFSMPASGNGLLIACVPPWGPHTQTEAFL